MTTAHLIQFEQPGGPEVLQWVEKQLPSPGPGEIQVQNKAIGLNFVEIYNRAGLYPNPLPSGLGNEGAGIVVAVGPEVTQFKEGDRVAYGTGPSGAYSTVRNMPARHALHLPASIGFDTAAAMMLKGLTVQYLLRQTYRVQAGDVIVFHAAAGGVGLIACQWAKALGATTIGTVSTPEKADLAKANGCHHVVIAGSGELVNTAKHLTNGQGVPVVYDSVGKVTFIESLDCLRRRGLLVSFGNASGPVDPFPLSMLTQRGGLYVTRPSIVNYTQERAELEAAAEELFDMVAAGAIHISINQRFALADAAAAHTALASRQTTGSSVLIP